MSLSNWPDYILIQKCNHIEKEGSHSNLLRAFDSELDLRNPQQAAWYFGDCAGQLIFIPVEREYDSEGQPIVSEMMGYSDKGEEVWN